MNKSISTFLWFRVLMSISILILVGCSAADNITQPLQTPVATVPYVHYAPSKKFDIHLEFDYPSSWIYEEEKEATDIIAISLRDPKFLNLPTPLPPNNHPTPNDIGSIVIWVTSSKPGQTPKTVSETLKQNYSKLTRINVLNVYETSIDGYSASILEYQDKEPIEGYDALMFNRRIFFIVKDQMYEIHFSVAEKERDGEFEQGYEYFFNSLNIVP